jgi:iron complex transport system substrate-binding protein
MKRTAYSILLLCCASLFAASCSQKQQSSDKSFINNDTRIVSLNGTVTEILCSLGLESKIVGVDVTSTYPAAMTKLPRVGHNRDISAEAVLGLKPTLVIGLDGNIKPELAEQLKSANVRLLLYHPDDSIEGAKKLITQLADTLGYADKADAICKEIDRDTTGIIRTTVLPKVLFIYARGTGTMMVAGKNNAVNSMIELAGGQNAVKDFDDYKPLTAEAVVSANPDVILMFDKGLESLGGISGLLQVQGIAQTNAGKNKKVIEMDGQFLTGFGPRTGKAIAELSKKINEAAKP